MALFLITMCTILLIRIITNEKKLLAYRERYIATLPKEVRYHFPTSLCAAVCKRLFDIIFSLGVLLTLFPLIFLILAPLIKLTSPGPVFFIQKRLGLYGQLFNCYKFRSMYLNSGTKPAQKNDCRVTKIGKFIRKTHLDEFPQFFNVLIGDMSIVGPRPFQVHIYQKFPYYEKSLLRLIIRPGITVLAQLDAPRTENLTQYLKLDFYYIRKMSCCLDFRIILRTMLLKDHSF